MNLSRQLPGLVLILGFVLAACGGVDSGPDTTGPTAFRLTALNMRDPHAFVTVFCVDGTSILNDLLSVAITTDGDNDDLLDLSMAIVFRPLDQSRATTPAEIHFPDCTSGSIACTAAGAGGTPPLLTTANNDGSTGCLAPTDGTTSGYSPGVPSVVAPCFASDPASVGLTVQGTAIALSDAQIGATYSGTPAASLTDGLLKGFISEADAQTTMLNIPNVGMVSLASVLPGGQGSCANGDDRDMNNGVSGWWMYFELTAELVPWTD